MARSNHMDTRAEPAAILPRLPEKVPKTAPAKNCTRGRRSRDVTSVTPRYDWSHNGVLPLGIRRL
jgi:hypothetical protein